MAVGELSGKKVPIKVWTDPEKIEWEAKNQLYSVAALPWVFKHIAVMPDVHYGRGATVGSVIAMKGAVAPAAVGVDIGCGMGAVLTDLRADQVMGDALRRELRLAIEEAIPVGFNAHPETHKIVKNSELFTRFKTLHPKVQDLEGRARQQCGTLGGGNHFIELCIDTDGRVWMMLHSGSRNIGKSLAEIHMSIAKTLVHNHTREVPDRDMSVFLAGTPEMAAYRRDLMWAQEYAFLNRKVMFEIYKDVVRKKFGNVKFGDTILCHHNYVSEETHFGEQVIVTRKGAISARKGEMGIIPGSMGTKSYIVKGKGNEESFHSASHGAGRVLSRNKANKQFTVADMEAQTAGVECRKDKDVIDEIPAAYKPIEEVMAYQSDLVEIVAELKQVLCVKG